MKTQHDALFYWMLVGAAFSGVAFAVGVYLEIRRRKRLRARRANRASTTRRR